MITIKCENINTGEIVEKSGENYYEIMQTFDSTNFFVIEIAYEDWMERKLPRKRYQMRDLF